MELNLSDINAEFGVGGIVSALADSPDGASHPDPSMPQSLSFVEEQYLPTASEPQVMDAQHNPINPWPPQLITELALQLDDTEIVLERHGVSPAQYQQFLALPIFRREVAAMMKEMSDSGHTYKIKARIQAEGYLPVVDEIVNNSEIAASTRMDAIKYMGKMGDLEPREKKQDQGTGATVNVQINF